VPEHEAAHFHLLPRLRMSGIAQYIHFVCLVYTDVFFLFHCVRPSKFSISRSVTFVVWACGRGQRGFPSANTHVVYSFWVVPCAV
jgi:hypothetical protein